MNTTPLKIDTSDGEIKNFQTGDKLSLENEVMYNRLLIKKLIETLYMNGIDINDKELLKQI